MVYTIYECDSYIDENRSTGLCSTFVSSIKYYKYYTVEEDILFCASLNVTIRVTEYGTERPEFVSREQWVHEEQFGKQQTKPNICCRELLPYKSNYVFWGCVTSLKTWILPDTAVRTSDVANLVFWLSYESQSRCTTVMCHLAHGLACCTRARLTSNSNWLRIYCCLQFHVRHILLLLLLLLLF